MPEYRSDVFPSLPNETMIQGQSATSNKESQAVKVLQESNLNKHPNRSSAFDARSYVEV